MESQTDKENKLRDELAQLLNAVIARGGTTALEEPFTPEQLDRRPRQSGEVMYGFRWGAAAFGIVLAAVTCAVGAAHAASAPTILSWAPMSGPPGTVVTIRGENLAPVTTGAIGGARGPFTSHTDSVIQIQVTFSGATGPIQLSGPTGSAATNSSFVVTSGPQIQGTYLGFPIFTPGDVFVTDVTSVPVDPKSATIVAGMGALTLQPAWDLNASHVWPYNYVVADATTVWTPLLPPDFKHPMVASPSLTFPWSHNSMIEVVSDHHTFAVDPASAGAYELWNARFLAGQGIGFGGGRWWNIAIPLTAQYAPHLQSGGANAADIPWLPGMVLGDRDCCGVPINHALLLVGPATAGSTSAYGYVRPAGSPIGDPNLCGANCAATKLVYGDHFRLRSTFTLRCSPACPQAQAMVQALKTYGAFYTDVASGWTLIIGNAQNGSNPIVETDFDNLSQIRMADFNILDRRAMGGIICSPAAPNC